MLITEEIQDLKDKCNALSILVEVQEKKIASLESTLFAHRTNVTTAHKL